MDYLYIPLPLWACILTFFVGWCLGWFTRGLISTSSVKNRVRIEKFVQLIIIVLWVIATSRAVFLDNVEYPPTFLNLMFGAMVGSLNKDFGAQMVSYVSAIAESITKKK